MLLIIGHAFVFHAVTWFPLIINGIAVYACLTGRVNWAITYDIKQRGTSKYGIKGQPLT